MAADPVLHVVGGGVAGIACALSARDAGFPVRLYESRPITGGRCRSFDDARFEAPLDTGSHILMRANRDALWLLGRIGAGASVTECGSAAFHDALDGARWTLPMDGLLGARLLAGAIPGCGPTAALRSIASVIDGTGPLGQRLRRDDPLRRRFWEPLALAVLNTPLDAAAASPMGAVLRRAFARPNGARPLLFNRPLRHIFGNTAADALRRAGVEIFAGRMVSGIEIAGDQVTSLRGRDGLQPVGPRDRVVLATLQDEAARLFQGVAAPADGYACILNLHYRLQDGVPPGSPRLLGLVGTLAQWAFPAADRISVTISAADGLRDADDKALADSVWAELRQAMPALPPAAPDWRIVREKRATLRQTPMMVAARPAARTALANLFLAGDWTDTGLPCTIDGAAWSGRHAARLALAGW